MPTRLVDLAPGAIALLQRLSTGEVRMELLSPEVAGFLQVLKARGLVEYGEATETLAFVRLTPDGQCLFEEGHF